jgi:hypothetical protein
MAMRFHARYVEMRQYADHHGGDFADHDPLLSQAEAEQRYEDAVNEWIGQTPGSTSAVLALVEFAGLLAADRAVGEVTRAPVNEERDTHHQAIALAYVVNWLNSEEIAEYTAHLQERTSAEGSSEISGSDLQHLRPHQG